MIKIRGMFFFQFPISHQINITCDTEMKLLYRCSVYYTVSFTIPFSHLVKTFNKHVKSEMCAVVRLFLAEGKFIVGSVIFKGKFKSDGYV